MFTCPLCELPTAYCTCDIDLLEEYHDTVLNGSYDDEPEDIDGGELSFDPYAGTAIYGEDYDDGLDW